MHIEEYITFIFITFLFVLSPGPAVMHAINNGIKYGSRVSSWGVLGNVAALVLLVIISSIGLGSLLAASDIFFNTLKIIGAAYLFYLGIKIWFSGSLEKEDENTQNETKSHFSIFKEAFLVTATNPKALAYVTALLPQFLHTSQEIIPQILLLGTTIAVVQFVVLMSYVWFSSKSKHLFEKEIVGKTFNKIAGLVFMGFGILIGVSSREAR